jgi:transcriptional regulator with XRE-family HTH domain
MQTKASRGFGALLRQFRAAAGMSQVVLAERAGLSRRGIADLERGARNFPYGDTIRRLADALNLQPDERAALLAAGNREASPGPEKRGALPVELTSLVGREREISEIQLLLIESMQGESEAAVAHFEEAIAIERRLGDAWGQAYVLNDLAQHERDHHQLERAQALEEEAHALWVRSGSRMGQRAAMLNLSVINLEREDLRRARELMVQTLRLCEEIADASATTVRCVEVASEILQASQASETVVILESAASAQREALGAPMPPNERAERERTRQAAASVLPATQFERAWQRGQQLSIRGAVEVAIAELVKS